MSYMTPEMWTKLKYFKPTENWGNPAMMDSNLIYILEFMRIYVNKPIQIHCGYSLDGHSPQSFHYKGLAVDLHIVELNLLDQYLVAELFDFRGIGVYPYWNTPGLHLDIRPSDEIGKQTRWYQDKDKKYHPLTSIAFS